MAGLAVGFVGLAAMIASGTGGASQGSALFKTGNPSLGGASATLGAGESHVEIPATLEATLERRPG
ncbi:hypothetical protein [Enhygromyxa salina]|uniref:hypothetical protein n=1 Tax=Enhygromyxa salina TaxID=215803 RepID=UPI0011B21DB3|nr:hypothetical protein [Enhygromyxa salina]